MGRTKNAYVLTSKYQAYKYYLDARNSSYSGFCSTEIVQMREMVTGGHMLRKSFS